MSDASTAAPRANRQIQLARRPVGLPQPSDFELVEVPVRELEAGELQVRNTWFSVDPYMRLRMEEGHPYGQTYPLGAALDYDAAIGVVEASTADGFAVGDVVSHAYGWRERAVVEARHAKTIDVAAVPPEAHLGVLGWPGYTAWVGLLEMAGLREGDVVFVSGAAGAVGSIAGQIAKLRGHRVIGSAGSDEKVALLRDELGFDAAFNYRSGNVTELLRAAAPEGIDVYFDNVGADHLEAAIDSMRDHGRVAMCGAIAAYGAIDPPPAPRNLFMVTSKQLRLQGFLVDEDPAGWARFTAEVGPWVADGRLVRRETVMEGIEHAAGAFIGMLQGANTGKMLVRL